MPQIHWVDTPNMKSSHKIDQDLYPSGTKGLGLPNNQPHFSQNLHFRQCKLDIFTAFALAPCFFMRFHFQDSNIRPNSVNNFPFLRRKTQPVMAGQSHCSGYHTYTMEPYQEQRGQKGKRGSRGIIVAKVLFIS